MEDLKAVIDLSKKTRQSVELGDCIKENVEHIEGKTLTVKEEELSPSEMLRYFAGFVIQKLSMIYDAWDNGDLEGALSRAVRLVYFFPKDLKEKLAGDIEDIKKEMNATYNIRGFDFYSTQLEQNKAARRVAEKWLAPFVSKLTDLCDEKGYLEKQPVQPKYKKEGKLGIPE